LFSQLIHVAKQVVFCFGQPNFDVSAKWSLAALVEEILCNFMQQKLRLQVT
jgi:hypothetical protein